MAADDPVSAHHDIVAGPTTDAPLLESTRRALTHRVAVSQAEARLPSLVAAIAREGRLAWTAAAGQGGAAHTRATGSARSPRP